MFAVWAIALLCFVPTSHSAPVDCNDLVKPLKEVDFNQMEGTWAMVADSLKIGSQGVVPQIASLSITLVNLTFTRAVSARGQCFYDSHNISTDGPNFKVDVPYNYTGTILRTSCADCVVLRVSLDSPQERIDELCLFSKRREVEPKELREFISQVECMDMPKPFLMDPTAALCPVFRWN